MNKTEGRVRETEGCKRIRQRGRVKLIVLCYHRPPNYYTQARDNYRWWA